MFNLFKNKKEVPEETYKVLTIINEPEMVFDSDSVVTISNDGVLDTNSLEAIAKYKNNLRILVDELKNKKVLNGYRLIREDDFFPQDWKWWVASNNTGIEKKGSNLTYALRVALANRRLGNNPNNPYNIPIPVDQEKIYAELKKIDKDFGAVYSSLRFRSTKHFTINTPLGYTGDYNNVDMNRKFIVIDKPDAFLNSGYAYSLAYHDAYLDVTHEPLSISNEAIVLINYDEYKNIINDPYVAEHLSERRVVVYKGDECVAINMILSELGILPSRPGNRYIEYDNETYDLLEQNIKALAITNNIDYDISHASMYGKGHFTSFYDDINQDYFFEQEELLNFFRSKLPGYDNLLTSLKNSRELEKLIDKVGIERMIELVNEYNRLKEQELSRRFAHYKRDHGFIDNETSEIFKKTVTYIKNYYKNKETYSFNENEVSIMIKDFFQLPTVNEQLNVAIKLINLFENQRIEETINR